MSEFEPLQPNTAVQTTDEADPPFQVSEISVFQKLSSLNPSKATGPDGVPSYGSLKKMWTCLPSQ